MARVSANPNTSEFPEARAFRPVSLGSTLAEMLVSPWASVICLGVVIFAFALPPNGFGVPMCAFREGLGLPCPGCGLTRSFIRLAHGRVVESIWFHPLGLLLFPTFVACAALLPLGRERRERVRVWLNARAGYVSALAGVMLGVMVVTAAGRIIYILAFGGKNIW